MVNGQSPDKFIDMAHRPPRALAAKAASKPAEGSRPSNRSQKIPVCRPTLARANGPGALPWDIPHSDPSKLSLCTDRADRTASRATSSPFHGSRTLWCFAIREWKRAPIRPRRLFLPHDPVPIRIHPPSYLQVSPRSRPGSSSSSHLQSHSHPKDHNGRPHTLPFRLCLDMQDCRAAML